MEYQIYHGFGRRLLCISAYGPSTRQDYGRATQHCSSPGTLTLLMNPALEMLVFTAAFATILSFFTSMEDVALDAMIIDLTPTAELGKINAFMLTGKSVGLAGGGAVTSYRYGISGLSTVAMFVLASLFAIPALVAILFSERAGERLFPWTSGVASPECIRLKPQTWWSVSKETFAVHVSM